MEKAQPAGLARMHNTELSSEVVAVVLGSLMMVVMKLVLPSCLKSCAGHFTPVKFYLFRR